MALHEKIMNSAFWRVALRIQEALMFATNALILLLLGAVILSRYVFYSDLFGYTEVLLVLSYWMYFIGGSYASYEESQMKADILSNFMSPKFNRIMKVFIGFVQVFYGIVFSYWAFRMVEVSVRRMPRTTAWKIPFAVQHSAILFGFIMMTFYSVVYLMRDWSECRSYLQQEKCAKIGDING